MYITCTLLLSTYARGYSDMVISSRDKVQNAFGRLGESAKHQNYYENYSTIGARRTHRTGQKKIVHDWISVWMNTATTIITTTTTTKISIGSERKSRQREKNEQKYGGDRFRDEMRRKSFPINFNDWHFAYWFCWLSPIPKFFCSFDVRESVHKHDKRRLPDTNEQQQQQPNQRNRI